MAEFMPKGLQTLEWTGERYLPWVKNATLAYEHLHRYAFAARYARGKRVLDLGSGEGYGANILANTASSVLGIDIDDQAIHHASARYRRENLKFEIGSFDRVPVSSDGSFDLIVCFEAIEHTRDHDELLGEVKRLLSPGGLFMVSTPNKPVYHEESDEENPFHVRELDPDEFQHLLGRYFRESRFLGQRIHPGSGIWPLDGRNFGPIEELTVESGSDEFEFIEMERRVPLYIVALASDSPDALNSAGSVLLDSSSELLNENKKTIRELLQSRESREAISELQKDLIWLNHKFDDAQQYVAKLASDFENTQKRLNDAQTELRTIYSGNSWRLLNKTWRVRDSLMPPGSMRRQLLQRILALIAAI